jgi:hypothetical protein
MYVPVAAGVPLSVSEPLLNDADTPAGNCPPILTSIIAIMPVVTYTISSIAAPSYIVWLVSVAADTSAMEEVTGTLVMVVQMEAVHPESFCTVTHTVTLPDSGT